MSAGVRVVTRGLVHIYRAEGHDVATLSGIDLVVAEGEIYGFLGPNGAGKSTTVHMLTTLLPPTDGRARVAGFDVVKQGPKVRAAIEDGSFESFRRAFVSGYTPHTEKSEPSAAS